MKKDTENHNLVSQNHIPNNRLRGFALFSLLAALMLTLLLEALDQTIVGTALPQIVGELQGFDRYTWVVTAYLLASITMIPIVGKLSDQFGRKWYFITGVIVFLIGSLLSGNSQTMNQLITFRAIQGLGAGIGISLVFTVVGDIFPPADQARWQAIFAGVYGFSNVVGPTLGGWLTDHGPLLGKMVTEATRWRWIFYLNIPLGIFALIALLIFLPSSVSIQSNQYKGWSAIRRIDYLGALLASAATINLLLGLTWGGSQTYVWNSVEVVGTLSLSVVLYIILFIVERFALEPILPLGLFRNKIFAIDSILALLVGMILVPMVIYLPLYLQGVMGITATNSGAAITPLTVSLVVGSTFAGFIISRIGRYRGITIAGSILLVIGTLSMTLMKATTPLIIVSFSMVFAGIGLGIFFGMLNLVAQNTLPNNKKGVGTGAITYLRSLGQVLGLAIVGSIINNTIRSGLSRHIPIEAVKILSPEGLKLATDTHVLVDPIYRATVVSRVQSSVIGNTTNGSSNQILGQQIYSMLDKVFETLKQSLAQAIQHGFLTLLIFCLLLLLTSLFLKNIPLLKNWVDSATTDTKNN